eukprot:21779-Pyramimonas_sp.AAC.1
MRQYAFLKQDLRAEYFVKHRKVDRFKGQTKVKALKTGVGDIITTDEDEMREEVARFYEALFSDEFDPVLPKWVWQHWEPEAVTALPRRLDAQLLRRCLARLKPGKTCSTDDCIVMEMLRELSTETLDILAEIYVLRLRNHPSEAADPIFHRHQ